MKFYTFSLFVQFLASTEMNTTSFYQEYLRTRQEAAILMHHDAITGTHSMTVKRDYQNRIDNLFDDIDLNNHNLLN